MILQQQIRWFVESEEEDALKQQSFRNQSN